MKGMPPSLLLDLWWVVRGAVKLLVVMHDYGHTVWCMMKHCKLILIC